MKVDNLILVPYFEDVAAPIFCERLAECTNANDHVVVVDDGSVTTPFDESLLTGNNLSGTVIRLARNVGHQMALVVGVDYVTNNFEFATLTIMDSDGEDKPSDIQRLLEQLKQDGLDVVVATRRSRVESLRFKLFYLVYKLLFRILVGRVIGFGNFMVLTQPAAHRISLSPEVQLHLAASVINSKLKMGTVLLDRGRRYQGTSKMNIVSLTLHGLRSIMVFSDQVLVRITLFSVLFAVVVIIAMVAMTAMKISGAAIPGWYSTGGGILIVLLFQAGFMALMMLLITGKINNRPVTSTNWSRLILDVIKV